MARPAESPSVGPPPRSSSSSGPSPRLVGMPSPGSNLWPLPSRGCQRRMDRDRRDSFWWYRCLPDQQALDRSALGGVAFGGTAPKCWTKALPAPTGGITFSGAATTSILNVNIYVAPTPDGALTFTGFGWSTAAHLLRTAHGWPRLLRCCCPGADHRRIHPSGDAPSPVRAALTSFRQARLPTSTTPQRSGTGRQAMPLARLPRVANLLMLRH